MTKNQLITMTI